MTQDKEEEKTPSPARSSRGLILALWGLVALFVVGMLVYLQMGGKDDPCPGSVQVMGGDDLGGAFEAIDETGSKVSEKDVIMGPSLLYFGYTFCPDVCPIDTARNAEVTDILDERGLEIAPIFVTIDPERDTAEVLEEYTSYVHDRMIGITGSGAEIEHLKSLYKVYGEKQPSDDPEYYLVDHSAFSYFVTENGFVSAYSRAQSAEEIADNIQCQMKNGA